MSDMKLNKKYLGLRILTFPIKLIFSLLWYNLYSFLITAQWIMYGGEEIYYGKDKGHKMLRLIEQNTLLIARLKNNIRADVGDTIGWYIKDNPTFGDKLHTAKVAIIDEDEKNYGVYAEYGQDYVPFDEAIIIELKEQQ